MAKKHTYTVKTPFGTFTRTTACEYKFMSVRKYGNKTRYRATFHATLAAAKRPEGRNDFIFYTTAI